jgi:hypothetical protein
MFAAAILPGSVLAAGGFFSGLPDLPIMAGLTEDRAAAVIFDKPEGRIVKMTAKGSVTRAAVKIFYGRALPQLGWKKAGLGRFRRDGEILHLEVSGKGTDLTVRISLSPERPATN